jgi:DNA-binding transcriptional LysR family regulator
VQLEEHVSSAIAAAVADSSADFGILSELPMVAGLATTPFRNDELVVVLQPDHLLAGRQTLAFAEIADQPFVGLHADSALHHTLARAAAETGRTLNWRINVTSFDAACAMVAAGLGVGIMPRGATTPYIRSLSLTCIALSDAWARRQLFLCTRANTPLPSAARLLFEHLLGQKQTP